MQVVAWGYAAEQGWRIVPLHAPRGSQCDCGRVKCPSTGKHPRINNWPDQATTDSETIGRWWQQWPNANIGIATGKESGLLVLDIDPKNGGLESLDRLLTEHGSLGGIETPTVQTGSGGIHFYFAYPEGLEIGNKASIAPGIDIRSNGGQCAAPPSMHYSGERYAWYEGFGPETPLATVPRWLLDMIVSPVEHAPTTMIPGKIPEGARRQHMLSFAGTMRQKGAPESTIYAALVDLNDERCSPPLDRQEIADLAADVASRYQPSESLIYKKTAPAQEVIVPKIQFMTANEIMATTFPETVWAIPGLLPEGLTLFAGRPKIGKSWAALNIALAVAEGGIAFGALPVEDGDVLYLALEDHGPRIQRRLKMMSDPGARFPDRLIFTTAFPKLDQGGLETISRWIEGHAEARMIIIDTLQKFRPAPNSQNRKGNAYAEDYQTMEAMQTLALNAHVALVLITHYRKQMSDDWMDAVTGSSGMTGAADSIWGLERPRGQEGHSTAILHVTGRDIEEQDYGMALEATKGIWSLTGDAATARFGKETAGLISVMAGFGSPCRASDIYGLMNKRQNTVKTLMWRAATAGLIDSLGGGFYRIRAEA